MRCKYLFQDKEKFNGEEYCTLHNELCSDISFACPDNCQIYEDNKKLEKYKHSLSNIKRFVMYWVPKTKQNILFKRDILQEVQSAEREDKQC